MKRQLTKEERNVFLGKLLAKGYTLTKIGEEMGESRAMVQSALVGRLNSSRAQKIRKRIMDIIDGCEKNLSDGGNG